MALISNHYSSNWSHVLFWQKFFQNVKEKKEYSVKISYFSAEKKGKFSGIFFKKLDFFSPHLDSDFWLVDFFLASQ